jgi:hypothetical protein
MMLAAIRTTTPPAASTGPAKPTDLAVLHQQFADLATSLEGADTTLSSMVTGNNPVGTGWGPYLDDLASKLQGARDSLLLAKPDVRDDLGAKLGTDVLHVSEAAGSLSVMARDRATLSAGWSTYLDGAIADAHGATDLLAPPTTPPTTPPATPPATPPKPPTTPPATPPATTPISPALASDLHRAIDLIGRSVTLIHTVPASDRGEESSKQARIDAYHANMDAQHALEPHFAGESAAVTSTLRSADAHLEDANWQLAKKPSPDGRFTGVDVPGALRDSQAAVDLLTKLVAGA